MGQSGIFEKNRDETRQVYNDPGQSSLSRQKEKKFGQK